MENLLEKQRRKNCFKPFSTTILIFVMITILQITLISAFEFDNVKTFDKDIGEYGKITITNSFGFGKDLWTGTLHSNTDVCGIDCSAVQTIILHEKGVLIEDIEFKILRGGKWNDHNIQDYEIFVNGNPYKLETELEAGTYEVKLEGKKNLLDTVDWIYETQGESLDEWSTWGAGIWGDEFYVVINADEMVCANFTVNDVTCTKLYDNYWKLNTTDADELSRAKVMKTLFYGTDGTDTRILNTTNVNAIYVNDSRDADKSAFLIHTYCTGNSVSPDIDIVFEDTSSNTDCSSWSNVEAGGVSWNIPDGSLRNNAADEIGTDTSADEVDNPADARMGCSIGPGGGNFDIDAMFLAYDKMHYTISGGPGFTILNYKDFLANDSIPAMTYVGGLSGISLDLPLDDFIISNYSVEFNGSADVTGASLVNISLWHNITGTFEINETNSTMTGTYGYSSFFINDSDATFIWSIQACDDDGVCAFANENRTATIDTIFPDLEITRPTASMGYLQTGGNESLNWTVSDTHLDTCWFDYNEINTTLNCLDLNYSFTITDRVYNLTLFANDTIGHVNSSFIEWDYAAFENSRSFNTYSYETASETFSINITAPTTITAVLNYNGTNYATTRTGTNPYIFNTTFDIPIGTYLGNKSFYWNFSSGGSYYQSNLSEQNISDIFFAECNATFNQAYLNLTVRDESNSSIIPDATIPLMDVSYYLGSGTEQKNFTYTNHTGNQNYSFCFSPVDRNLTADISLQYEDANGDYPQRTYEDVSVLTNASTDLTLYLLKAADGIYVTFQVINTADQIIEGAHVIATRVISGSTVTVGEGSTGSDGAVTFWLNPNYAHTITINKTGYDFYTTSLTPTQTSYSITLGGSSAVDAKDYFRGISYSILPSGTLNNDTTYSFEFNISSSHWSVDLFGFNLRLKNGTIIGSDTSTTVENPATYSYDVNNETIIFMDYYWVIEGNYTNSTKYWNVFNTENTQWSIKVFFDDFNLYMNTGLFGMDDFGRYLITFLLMFMVVGIMSWKYGLDSPISITTIIFATIFFFDVVTGILPTTVGPDIFGMKHILTYIAGLILTLVIFKEVMR